MVEKLNAMAKKHEKRPIVLPDSKFKGSTSKDLPCEHKDSSDSENDSSADSQDELESFSDIDDREIDRYLFNEEEKNYKKKIWENSNREYLLEQVAKELAAAMPKSKKVTKQKQAQQAKNSEPAQSAAVATCQTVKTKRLSSRVNHDCLAKLFEDEPAGERNPKRVRFDLASDNNSKFQSKVDDDDQEDEDQEDDELGSGNYHEGGDKDWYNNENMDEAYYPDEDGYNYYDDDHY
ncbi:uncharacterized protein LOC131609961 [Vicia villosa]|uniref:uncharacterized protein LOC131609961 n=1 Tax=Vicia villosa TaxID=3911 RepID=UPI00273AA25B|nr:uncharacterized protein LOC131609961 [Vicia villosa]